MYLVAFLCIVVHPKRFTIMWGGGVYPQPPPDILRCILLLLEFNFFKVNVKCARCFLSYLSKGKKGK